MADMLAYRTARRHVRSFEKESKLTDNHRAAMDCFDCEAFLQLGIDAFHWLVLADETFRRAIFQGAAQYNAKTDQAIKRLFVAWLRPCQRAMQWIDLQERRGYRVANLDEFRKCQEEVLAIAQSLESDVLTDAMRKLRDEALREHRHGKTAEFV